MTNKTHAYLILFKRFLICLPFTGRKYNYIYTHMYQSTLTCYFVKRLYLNVEYFTGRSCANSLNDLRPRPLAQQFPLRFFSSYFDT